VAAVAFDYFGRTAGLCDSTGTRADDFEFRPHVDRTTEAGSDADLAAVLTYLRGRTRSDLPVVTVGFCFGGSHSWRQSGGSLPVQATAGFYGRPARVGDAAQRAHLPTLMLVAGADRATPVEESLALAETMRGAGADVETAVYEGAPHSFFDRAFGDWQEACADAWQRMLALVDRVDVRV
jgi:carboxymethylenebutenolidase